MQREVEFWTCVSTNERPDAECHVAVFDNKTDLQVISRGNGNEYILISGIIDALQNALAETNKDYLLFHFFKKIIEIMANKADLPFALALQYFDAEHYHKENSNDID